MSGLPLLFNASGPVPTPPATLQQQLIALVQTLAPGYSATLPSSLIEDLSSTAVGALMTIDQARVDAVNNVTPYGANPYTLAQLGAMLGVPQGTPTNGSVYVVFTGSAGYVIPPGFLVSDGSNQYSIQDGGIIQAGGTSVPLYAVATNTGIFSIPAGAVTTVVTSVPTPYSLTVTNPLAGVPASSSQSIESYRSQVIQALQVSMTGEATYLKTLLLLIPNVSPRLISVLQQGYTWEVLCGGGDPYLTAYAIYSSGVHIGLLAGSQINPSRNVTASIYDAPNTYSVIFVNPPQQLVTATITWNTTLANFTAAPQVNQLISTTAQSYINSIIVGQPINLLVLTEQIQQAIASILAPVNLTRLAYSISIGGVVTPPTSGTQLIPSDPESYFYASPTSMTVAQG